MYERQAEAPVRIALEMRLTGGSEVLLAPQAGNTASASIEFLSTLLAEEEGVWHGCVEEAAARWAAPELDTPNPNVPGGMLRPRPHWAKQWQGISVRGKTIERYLKEDAYKDAFPAFREAFKGIVTSRESTVEETLNMFGNDLMKRLIFE